MRKTGLGIARAAYDYKDYAYWYGAKGEEATLHLLNLLAKQNPGVYSQRYIETCKNDIGKRVCDCSGLVCHALNIANIGSYQIKEKFREWAGEPKEGMIAWRPGHVAIFRKNGYLIEMQCQENDFRDDRHYKEADIHKILYSPEINYDCEELYVTKGWHLVNGKEQYLL